MSAFATFANLVNLEAAVDATTTITARPDRFVKSNKKALTWLNESVGEPRSINLISSVTLFKDVDGNSGYGDQSLLAIFDVAAVFVLEPLFGKAKGVFYGASEIGPVQLGFNEHLGPAVQAFAPSGGPLFRLVVDDRIRDCEREAQRILAAIDGFLR